MIEARAPALIDIDECASEPNRPFGIITSDSPGTRQFDDGIAVTPLPCADEAYHVSVFAVDTSPLYHQDHIAERVVERARTVYHDLGNGLRLRDPMLTPDITQKLHFSAHNGVKRALVVSYIVGRTQPPQDTKISFGEVEVLNNYPYNTFGGMCRDRETFKRFGRAAAFILGHLRPAVDGMDFEQIYDRLIHVPREQAWQRGENITKAFTISTNWLVAASTAAENSLAIYRTNFDTSETRSATGQPKGRYSLTPGPHLGLQLGVYSRVTSPLWRGEDFMMHGLLDARHQGRALTARDESLARRMIDRLNTFNTDQPQLAQAI